MNTFLSHAYSSVGAWPYLAASRSTGRTTIWTEPWVWSTSRWNVNKDISTDARRLTNSAQRVVETLSEESSYSHPVAFVVPDHYEMRKVRSWRDANGTNWRSLGNACWFTNLDIAKRHEDLILIKQYSPDEHPRYDNYDAIEVPRYKDIPSDFDGVMGVPITFLEHHNPDQFEVVGTTNAATR